MKESNRAKLKHSKEKLNKKNLSDLRVLSF